MCASRRSSTTSQLEATSGRSVTIAGLADVFAVQDEITEAIVASIEPQLYATENFHCQRNAPESLDAWGLVMRALSHFWRVTRQDNIVAQALLEKAIAIDPNYGQALGVLASSHAMCAYNGWAEMATPLRLPSAPRWRQPAPTATIHGRTTHWGAFICCYGVSTIPLPSSSWR